MVNLFIEYYTPSDKNRDWEYKTCISENVNNELIKKIFIFISDDSKLDVVSDKIEIIKLDTRPSFKFSFDWCNEHHDNEVCIISNTDIIFDNTLSSLVDLEENDFLALTRWDLLFRDGKWFIQYYDFPWRNEITTTMMSQDSWIFKAPMKIREDMNFLMGKPGCDNRISQIIHELGYSVKNPSKLIVTKHLHLSNHRTYNHTDMILGPYLLVNSTDSLKKDSDKKTILGF